MPPALSGDPALIDAYLGGDVYHALAYVCGLTDDPDPKRWKTSNARTMRQRMKALQLGDQSTGWACRHWRAASIGIR